MQPDKRAPQFENPLDFNQHRPAAWPLRFVEMRLLLIGLLFLAGCVSGREQLIAPGSLSYRIDLRSYGIGPKDSSDATEEYLRQTLLPSFRANDVDVRRLVDSLNRIGKETEWNGYVEDHPELIFLPFGTEQSTVSFLHIDISFIEIIEEICRQANLRWWIDGDVFLVPEEYLDHALEDKYPRERRTRHGR